jgi:hypothetical protein
MAAEKRAPPTSFGKRGVNLRHARVQIYGKAVSSMYLEFERKI